MTTSIPRKRMLVRGHKNERIWVPKRAWDRAGHGYYAGIGEMVLVPGDHLVIELDVTTPGEQVRKPVAVVRSANNVKFALAAKASKKDRLFYIDDLVDLTEICKRVQRTKATVSGNWMKDRLFPKHIKVIGQSKVWYWQDIVEWRAQRFRRR